MTDLPNLANRDYVGRVNRAIDHILQHLDQPLRLEEVSRVACFSPYHFHPGAGVTLSLAAPPPAAPPGFPGAGRASIITHEGVPVRLLILILVCFAAGVTFGQVEFVDVASSRGLDHTGAYGQQFPGLTWPLALLQHNVGNGVAVGDYDNDGDADVYLLGQYGFANRLFRNDSQMGAPAFRDVTAWAGVGDTGMSRTALFADLDNDGWLDLVVLNDDDGVVDTVGVRVFRNRGDGRFADVSQRSTFQPGLLRCGGSLADFDHDGLLDLYVTNWSGDGGSGMPGFVGENRLYRNLGNFTFADVTDDVGLAGLIWDSFTAIFHDLDGDYSPDVYVAIDHFRDEFFRSLGGQFSMATSFVGLNHIGNDMGVAVGDIDGDDDLDIFASNITDPTLEFGTTQYNVLYLNREELGWAHFVDRASQRGVHDTQWGWGTELFDADLDGDLDLVVGTGFDAWIAQISGTDHPLYRTPSALLVNDGTGSFARTVGGDLQFPDDTRALVAVDYDGDGDRDVVTTNVDQPVRLFENRTATDGHWLRVQVVDDTTGNRDAVGATVRVVTGAQMQRRDRILGDSYLVGALTDLHFGLGDAPVVDILYVRWPDGLLDTYLNVPVDRRITLHRSRPDTDGDGLEDGIDLCPEAADPAQADADGDGRGDACDCAPADATVRGEPTPPRHLRATGSTPATFEWAPPAVPGADDVELQLVRSTRAAFDAGVVAIPAAADGVTAVDAETPDSLFFYRAVAVSRCPAR